MIAVILLTTLMPAHYHLHHVHNTSDTVNHHAIDLHFVTADTDQSHHDEYTSIFAATPDVIVKKGGSDMHLLLLLTLILLSLPMFKRIGIGPCHYIAGFKQHHPYLSPPLRAPPVH